MRDINKAHLFFEQSGTFKNQFKKLGIDAADYDIQNDKEKKTILSSKKGKQAGVCSEEHSMISPDYARNFICDFIIGREQVGTQLSLF